MCTPTPTSSNTGSRRSSIGTTGTSTRTPPGGSAGTSARHPPLEGYLSQELLFDKQTYELIGDRLIAVHDHVNRADDGTSYIHQGDLFRQVIYTKMIIVDKPGETS